MCSVCSSCNMFVCLLLKLRRIMSPRFCVVCMSDLCTGLNYMLHALFVVHLSLNYEDARLLAFN